MTEKIGTDIPAKSYWKEKTERYLASLNGPYHRHRLAMVKHLLRETSLAGAACLDFGCGEGIFSGYLLNQGATVTGYDIDETMITKAQENLRGSAPYAQFSVGNVDRLADVADSSIDLVVALNVLAYFKPQEEATFYQQSRRILKPGGHLLITHSNELFDMFTFNRYTVAFFKTHFSHANIAADPTSLLTNPDLPDRQTFAIRENPLNYRYKLKRYGFDEREQQFASLHPLPPLLMKGWDPDDINAHTFHDTLNWPDEEKWKLAFMCSMFGSYSRKA